MRTSVQITDEITHDISNIYKNARKTKMIPQGKHRVFNVP